MPSDSHRTAYSLVAFAILAILAAGSSDSPSSTSPSSTTHRVAYSVSGTADSVSVTYTNSEGGTSQEADVRVPWSYSFTGKSGHFAYISAQNKGKYGTVTCTISVDGSTAKSGSSSGAYVIANASTSIP